MTHPHPVEPLGIEEVTVLFEPADFPWWIGGGWGLDLFLGHETRSHEDTDVLVLRRDQERLQKLLEGWDLHVADPPGTGALRPWAASEQLELPVHEIWCRREPNGPWQLEIVLGDTNDERWVFRRNTSVTRALEVFGGHTGDGIPYVAPEILLLFKANHLRPKDQEDFDIIAGKLPPQARDWLRQAIAATHPEHPWLKHL